MANNTAGLVTVSRDSSTITYTINEKSLFFSDGYKALHTHLNEGFLKCGKSNINGRIKLTYDISKLTSLNQMLPEMTDSAYLKVISGILNTVIALRDISFIQHENISLEPSDIFVDPKTMQTYLLYLPLNIRPSANAHIVFENEIREKFVKMANEHRNIVSNFTLEICTDLVKNNVSFQAVVEKIIKQDSINAAEAKFRRARVIGDTQAEGTNPVYKVETPQKEKEQTERPRIDFSDKSYDKSFHQPVVSEKKSPAKKKNSKLAKSILFFWAYIVVLTIAFFVAFNYYKNSGMVPGFILVLVSLIMGALLAPILYFSKGNKKSSILNETLNEEKVEGIGKSVEGFISPMVLRSINDPNNLEFFINIKEYFIGKDKQQVQGFIPFDKSVSDIHCEIVWDNGFYIYDLDSEFGTFVNEVNIIPGQKFPLKNKDKIKISKHIFEVLLEK